MPRKKKTIEKPFTPVELLIANRTVAVGIVKKKPTKRSPNPYWRMEIKTKQSERIFINLGRYERGEVLDIMLKAYQEYIAKQPYLPPTDPSAYTITELLDEWYAKYVLARSPDSGVRKEYQLSPSTIDCYQRSIEQLKKAGGGIDLSTWTIGYFEDMRLVLQRQYSPRTVHLYIGILKRVLQWAERRNKPIQKIHIDNKRPPRSQHVRNERTPTEDEARTIFEEAPDSPFKIIFLLCWKTGARVSEIVDLEWERIEEDEDCVLLHLIGKTGKRVVPIEYLTYQMVLDFFQEKELSGRLFKGHYRSSSSARLGEVCEQQGIETFTMHGLRRLRSDTLFRANIEPAVYESLMGHSVRTAIEAYRRPNLTDLKKASIGDRAEPKQHSEIEELLAIAQEKKIDLKRLLSVFLLT